MSLTKKNQRYARMSGNTVRNYTELKASASHARYSAHSFITQSHPKYHQQSISITSQHFRPTGNRLCRLFCGPVPLSFQITHEYYRHNHQVFILMKSTSVENIESAKSNNQSSNDETKQKHKSTRRWSQRHGLTLWIDKEKVRTTQIGQRQAVQDECERGRKER